MFVKNLLRPKSLDFIIARSQIFISKNIGIIAIFFADGLSLELNNIAYLFNYNSNLILFRQLKKNNIIYFDNTKAMTLI